MRDHASKLASAIYDLYDAMKAHLKPTPMKVQYAFNHRECFKLINAMCKVEGNYLKSEEHLMRLFYHEAMRMVVDKMVMKHDI